MKTAGWFTYSGPGRISISRGTPRGAAAGFRKYSLLAPGTWFRSVSPREYERLFFEHLDTLDPQRVHDELHELAGGAEPHLLCYENPAKPDDWCHRAMVSLWFADKLGIAVPEYGHEARGHGPDHPMLPRHMRPGTPPPDERVTPEEIAAFTGRTCWHHGFQYEVLGPSDKRPSQAVVRRSDGVQVLASIDTLRRRFG